MVIIGFICNQNEKQLLQVLENYAINLSVIRAQKLPFQDYGNIRETLEIIVLKRYAVHSESGSSD